MKVLEACNITKVFPGVVALDSVDISFELGEIHCVIGENGAGKSTLIKCLTGVYEPEAGTIMIDGADALKNKKLFDKIAYVPQEIDLFEHMTVADNLFLPYEKPTTGWEQRVIFLNEDNFDPATIQEIQIGINPTVDEVTYSLRNLKLIYGTSKK